MCFGVLLSMFPRKSVNQLIATELGVQFNNSDGESQLVVSQYCMSLCLIVSEAV